MRAQVIVAAIVPLMLVATACAASAASTSAPPPSTLVPPSPTPTAVPPTGTLSPPTVTPLPTLAPSPTEPGYRLGHYEGIGPTDVPNAPWEGVASFEVSFDVAEEGITAFTITVPYYVPLTANTCTIAQPAGTVLPVRAGRFRIGEDFGQFTRFLIDGELGDEAAHGTFLVRYCGDLIPMDELTSEGLWWAVRQAE